MINFSITRQLACLCLLFVAQPASAVSPAPTSEGNPGATSGPVAAGSMVGDPFGQHHSAGTQITPQNVSKLRNAWILRTGDQTVEAPAVMKNSSGQATAILLPPEAGEHLVTCTPFSRVIALDPGTGKARWEFDPKVERGGKRGFRCRGVSYWRSPGPEDEAAVTPVGPAKSELT